MSTTQTSSSRASFALGVLTLVNLLNYTDRYIVAGAMKEMQSKFSLDDTSGGLLATTFMVVYMLASPLGGFLGDRLPRRLLIGAAVLIWSLATIASGLATSFLMLVIARAATGVGEAGYGTIAPSFISDLFKPERRSRMLAIFYTAMPLGAAAGNAPETESELLSRLVRLMLPGLDDQDYARFDAEIDGYLDVESGE